MLKIYNSKMLWGLLLLLILCNAESKAQNGWVNEIKYSGPESELENFIEIIVEDKSNFSPENWILYIYNGADGELVNSYSLSAFTEGVTSDNFTLYSKNLTGLPQERGGLALAYLGKLLQFTSYGGSFAATAGIALGISSEDVAFTMDNLSSPGFSIQLTGSGSLVHHFNWQPPAAATPLQLNNSQLITASDQSSTITNTSVAGLVSDAVIPFNPLSFRLTDASSDGLPTSLTRLLFKGKNNGIGIMDESGKRLEDFFQDFLLKNMADGTLIYPDSVTFKDYNTVVLHFPGGGISVAEGGTAEFVLFATGKEDAPLLDHSSFSFEVVVEEFLTGAGSSRLSTISSSFEGSVVEFDIEATLFSIREEPAVIRAVKNTFPEPDGEEFSVRITAIDTFYRKDVDFDDILTISLKENGETGRELYGMDGALYPEMLDGEILVNRLMYKGSNVPEYFQLEVTSSSPLVNPGISDPIYAVEEQDKNSTASVVTGSGTENFHHLSFQATENLDVANTAELVAFAFEDSPGFSNDKLPTTITGLDINITNPQYLRSIGLFHGTTKIMEQTVNLQEDGAIEFNGFSLVIGNNQSEELELRATFRDTVDDNAKIAIELRKIYTEGVGSQFSYPDGVIPEGSLVVGNSSEDDINRLEVVGRLFHFISQPEDVEIAKDFAMSLEVVDEFGNRDLDANPLIEISKASGPGNLNLDHQQFSINAGYLEINGLVIDQAGFYSIQLADKSTSIVSGSTHLFQVFAPWTYHGLLISEIGHGTVSGTPKYLELYNASDSETFGLENLELRVYENGATTPSYTISFNEGASLAPEELYVISNVAFSSEWGGSYTSFSPQQLNTGMVGNGNDVYELYDFYRKKVIDVYGIVGENGNGKSWDYTESLVNRRATILQGNNGIFNVAEFTIVPYSHGTASPGEALTADAISPSAAIVKPENGNQAVMENSSFVFHFNELLNFENKLISFKRKDNNETVYFASLTNTVVVTGEGTDSLVVKPAQLLPSSTALYISIEEGGLTDLAGNSVATLDYQFKTTDSIKPTILQFEPADNATNAALSPVFRLTFSEDIIVGSGTISIYSADNGSFVTAFPVTSGFVRHPSPKVLEFELLDRLNKLSSYYVLASDGIVKDAAGNLFGGIKTEEDWNFKTIDPYVNSPKIVQKNPASGEQFVAQDHTFRISFHEPVVAGSGTIELYNSSTGALISYIVPELAAGMSISGNEVAFTFGTLELNTAYYILVREGAFKDTAGNPIEGLNNNTNWAFITVPHTNPLIVVDSPERPLYFGNVEAGTKSSTMIYRLAGRNLQHNVELQIPAGFIVSFDGGNTYQKGSKTLTVEELESFREILVKFAPEVADGILYQDVINHISEGAPLVQLEVLGREGQAPVTMSIAEARALGVGNTVKLSGIVTDGNSFGTIRRFIQDETAGIALYHLNNSVLASLQAGTKVLVTGELEEDADGLLQLGGDALDIIVEEEGVPIPEPVSLYAPQLGELVESQLAEIRNLRFERAGERFSVNQTYLVSDTKGNIGEIKIEGVNNTLINVEIPAIATVKGLIAPYNSGHVLLPRGTGDLEMVNPELNTALPDGKLNFGFVEAGEYSDVLRLRVYAQDLVEDIEIQMPVAFEISTSSVGIFSRTLKIPASSNGVDVWVRFAPEEANGSIYQDFIKVNSSSAPEVLVAVGGVEGIKPASVTIAQARVMPLGEEVEVTGTVSSANTVSYIERYLQDATAGIVAIKEGDPAFSDIPVGAKIKVSGVLQESENLLQIGGALSWTILDENAGEPASMLVNDQNLDEENEARLVQLSNINFIDEGNLEGGRKYKFLFSSGESGWLKMPAGDHPLVGERLPYKANLKGVLSQIGEEYVVIPRDQDDLEALDAVVTTTFPEGPIEFFFIPAGEPSEAKYFMLTGSNLQGAVNVSTSSPFEVSTDGVNYSISAEISQENASDVKVYIRFKPVLAGGGVSEDFLTIQTANGRPVKIPLTGIEGSRPEILSIAQARALGAGERVKVQAIITTNGDFMAEKRFIQDISAGLVIAADASEILQMEAGDKVEISGDLIENGGLMQLGGNIEFRITQKALGLPEAREITTAEQLSEENEAELINLPSVRFVEQGYFETGKSYTIILENGEETIFRLKDDHLLEGQLIPSKAGIQGVLAQNGRTYEIWPRNASDLGVISYPMAILAQAPSNGFDFGRVKAGTPSQWEQYTVSGLELTEDIALSTTAPFEISLDGIGWSSELTISKDAVNKAIYVRFNPQAASGSSFVAELVHSSGVISTKINLRAEEGEKLPAVGTELAENFDQCLDLNTFYGYDVAGGAQWSCAVGMGVDNSGVVSIFLNQEQPEKNEDWLISPALIITENSRLNFDIARQNEGSELELYISTNYTGSGNPAHANWQKIAVSIPAPSNSFPSFHNVSGIALGEFAGEEVYLAFKYTATHEEASVYLIDNFKLQDVPVAGFAESTVTIQEGTTKELAVSLSKPSLQATTIVLNVTEGSSVNYGESSDFITTPAAGTAQTISLPLEEGMQEVSFNLSLLEDWLEEEDEQLTIQIAEVGEEIIVDETARQLTVMFKSNNASEMNISTAREVSAEGSLTHINQLVKLKGIAYGLNLSEHPNGLELRLIDHAAQDNAAITVLAEDKSGLNYTVTNGDKLEVTGVLKEVNGLAILVPQIITILEENVSLLVPKVTAILEETNESELVELENVEVASGWKAAPTGSFMITVKDEQGREFQVQIREKSDLYRMEKPLGRFNVVGFVGQNDGTIPYTESYYLIPRSKEDLKLLTALEGPAAIAGLSLYPNPAATELHIRSAESQRFGKIEILSLNGNIIKSEPYRYEVAIKLGEIPAGMYLVRIYLKDGGYSINRISVVK